MVNDSWKAFVPFLSRLQLERVRTNPREGGAPTAEILQGAMLFLDVVGFSTVTERLRAQGPKGAELLSGVLDAYFKPVLDSIRMHGGDVLFFAGDALGVLWNASSTGPAHLKEAAIRSAQCALDIQAQIATIESPWGPPLQFRASVGVGKLLALEVGGVNGRWMEVVGGEALENVRRADRCAVPGGVVLSADCLRLLDAVGAVATPLADAHHRLERITVGLDPRSLPDLLLDADAAIPLRSNVGEVVAARIDSSNADLLAEFRQVTVMFTRLLGPGNGAGTGSDIDTLHRAVVVAQETVRRLEGVVYQLLEDDKGTCLVVAFGLPGTSHADDATRALLAAREIQAALRGLGLSPTSGVVTGTLYCGPHGGEHRRRYAIIGSTMNLAARLMTMAGARGTLCDAGTRKLVSRKIGFVEAGHITPKGFLAPVALFEPVDATQVAPPATGEHAVVGRTAEIETVALAMDAVRREGRSRLVVIRADAGMGKSTIIKALGRFAREQSVSFSLGAADSFETGTAYFAFRRIAREWFGIAPGDDAPVARSRIAAALEDLPELALMAPLLGGIIGFDFPETSETQQVRGQVRAKAVREMLLHAAMKRAGSRLVVLALEDGHWMDAASWQLLTELLARVSRTLVVLTTRPAERPPSELQVLLEGGDTQVLELMPFGRGEMESLTRAELDVMLVAPALLDFVSRRAEGNPLFAREIVRSLRESGGIRVNNARAELASDDGAALTLPSTLEGVITSRIDRLSHTAQLTIKVAAVLGRSFETELLLGIHPGGPDRATLEHALEALRRSSLLTLDERDGTNVFDHALTHEASYNLLTFAMRESLHRAAAEQLEHLHAGNLRQVHARVGYHFRMGQLPDRAVPHLAAAGEAAVDAYASRDALDLLTTTLKLDEQVRGTLRSDVARARWCRLIALAHYNQDQQSESGRWYRRSIGLAGAEPRVVAVSALATVLRGVFAPGSIGSGAGTRLDPDTRARLLEALAATRELAVVYLWENALGKFALNALNGARVARLLGPSVESADSNATLGYLVSVAGVRHAGERIALRAVEMADEAGDVRQFVSVSTIAGMLLTQNGRPLEGVTMLERSDRAAASLRAGMHRHRPKYMLADTLAWLGRYTEARPLFQHAAELSRGAEHHVMGMANAMAALTLLREGQVDAALNLLESPDGVASALESKMVVSIIIGLGVLAETRLELGDRAGALEAVREAERWMSGKQDSTSYFSSVFGHAAIARARLEADDPGEPVRHRGRRVTPLDLALGRIRQVLAKAPAARAPLYLLRGQWAAKQGHRRRARKLLREAVEVAAVHNLPYELGRSLVELAKITSGPGRTQLIDRAVRVFDEHAMVLESRRARKVLAQG